MKLHVGMKLKTRRGIPARVLYELNTPEADRFIVILDYVDGEECHTYCEDGRFNPSDRSAGLLDLVLE